VNHESTKEARTARKRRGVAVCMVEMAGLSRKGGVSEPPKHEGDTNGTKKTGGRGVHGRDGGSE